MTCSYCGSSEAEHIETKLPLVIPGLEHRTVSVFRCLACDLFYSAPLPGRFDATQEAFFIESWETDHRLDVMDDWIRQTWKPDPVWIKLARTVRNLISMPSLSASRSGEALRILMDRKPRTLLDIGTSYGSFVRSARLAGIEAFGTDPHRGLVKKLNDHGVDCISQGLFKDASGKYDALTFLSVVDHFPYITPKFFKDCAVLVNPGGCAIICEVDPTLDFVRKNGTLKTPISFSYLTVDFMKRAASDAGMDYSYTRCVSEPMYIFHVLAR